MASYPKRLIEVDLPIKRISAHARREKSIRHGHISTLHIWWARRPLAACRAVICAALWPDPADALCPKAFVEAARKEMLAWTSHERQILLSEESRPRFEATRKDPKQFDKPEELRAALLDFIADFANWDNSTVKEYLDTSRALTQAAHEALGGAPGTRPLVVDPFAGGGSIPLEALRVGADAFASDLNPIPVLLNKVVLEYIPKYGQRLADEVRKWGTWIKEEAEKELAEFYPKDADGATPIAYLWARTIQCEGPGCGLEVPLIRSLWIAKRPNRSVALQLISRPGSKQIDLQMIQKEGNKWVDRANRKISISSPVLDGTIKRGSVTCPRCGYTTPIARVREQLKVKLGGSQDPRLLAVVSIRPSEQGRFYRLPNDSDLQAVHSASIKLRRRIGTHKGQLSLVPNESTEHYHTFVNRGPIYGMLKWSDYFTPRQALAISTFSQLVSQVGKRVEKNGDNEFATAVQTCVALAVDRLADFNSSLARWANHREGSAGTFGRQALPMVWDFGETCPLSGSTGAIETSVELVADVLEAQNLREDNLHGIAEKASATMHPLPDDAAQAFITDPPYYYSVQYADLADFFYVWLRRSLADRHQHIFESVLTPKDDEIIVQSPGHQFAPSGKNNAFYESRMRLAMQEGRRVLAPSGIGLVVFAHTTTAGWEAQLQAMVDAGWIVTGSWPIDTEMSSRVLAQGRAVLASSVHLVCRPRENADGSRRIEEIGDWRDVLQELPRRIHEWMPRLAEEGVVGADAIFACLGPALEVFSRYSRVEKASGEAVTLKEYLEHVWAAVAKEALAQVFKDADTASFEPDARLTAMWLWTLNAGKTNGANADGDEEEAEDDEDAKGKGGKAKGGFVLEYDAARKIAQGLGANLEDLDHVVEVSGETARLLPVSERTEYLFGKEQSQTPAAARKKAKAAQMDLFGELAKAGDSEAVWGEKTVQRVGETTLDRVHQAMILFATGRSEALKRFLVDDGAGRDARFWGLAQALLALYPQAATEKRWVDGVLARKKGLGL